MKIHKKTQHHQDTLEEFKIILLKLQMILFKMFYKITEIKIKIKDREVIQLYQKYSYLIGPQKYYRAASN